MASLTTKVTAPLVLISALAIGLTAFLNLGKFDRTLGELEMSRVLFVINKIHANLETGVGMGLPLNGIANAQSIIEYEVKQDPTIAAIVIYDDVGKIAFHAGLPIENENVPQKWLAHVGSKVSKSWELKEKDEQVVGANLTSVIGKPVGGVALRYSLKGHAQVVEEVGSYLLRSSGIGIVLTALVAGLGISLLMRSTSSKLKRIESSLLNVENSAAEKSQNDAVPLASDVIQTSRAALRDLRAGQENLVAVSSTGEQP